MSMITGQGTALQIGQESTWGTAVSPTVAINFTSEGFKPALTTTEEDSLVGGATTAGMDIQKKAAVWSAEVLAKPENVGLLFGLAFGSEAAAAKVGTTNAYQHSFTMIAPGVSATLPKFTGVLNRHLAKKAYTGCKVDSLSIRCSAGDYMRLSLSGSGKEEIDGTSKYSSALTVSTKKAFRFAGGTATLGGTSYGSITGVTFNLSNSLDEGAQTLGSGYYGTEPEPQKRAVKVTIDAIYDNTGESIREDYYKKGESISCVLKFESPEEADATAHTKHSIEISIPNLVITAADPVVGDASKLKLTIEGTATEPAGTEAVTLTLVDAKSTKYLA